MGTRRNGLVFLALLVPSMAGAHEHNRAVFLGPSGRTGGSKLWGVHGSFEQVWGHHKHVDPSDCSVQHLSIVVDASAHFRSKDGFTLTAGPRYTFMGSNCPGTTHFPKPVFSVYVLPGAQKIKGATDDSWRLAVAAGAQLDILVRREDGIRVQVDVIRKVGGVDATYVRVSAGLLLRFFDD